jgi:hypothetical protein
MGILDYCFTLWASVSNNIDLFGAAGLTLGFATSVMPSRTKILITSAACGLCFSAHYLHLGSATGMAMAAISVAQSLVAARYGSVSRRPGWFNMAFALSMLMVAVLTGMTWNGLPSAFAGIGALFATLARMQTSSQAIRLLLLSATLCCAGHNAIVRSACGLTCDLLAISGFTVALIRSRWFVRLPKSSASYAGA